MVVINITLTRKTEISSLAVYRIYERAHKHIFLCSVAKEGPT